MHRIIKALLACLLICSMPCALLSQTDRFEKERHRMVRSQIQARGIKHRPTLDAMRSVPRHLYVPVQQQANAYQDRPLPIGYGQTISQPYIVAYMTQIIAPSQDQRILEIGTGSGYQAAVLAELADTVYTVEIIPELTGRARKVLSIHYNNVKIKTDDGYYGWEEYAPFDAIVVTAAADHIPPPLLEQLRDGGVMIIPVGSAFQVQQLMLVEKKDGTIHTRSLMPVRFVPFIRGSE